MIGKRSYIAAWSTLAGLTVVLAIMASFFFPLSLFGWMASDGGDMATWQVVLFVAVLRVPAFMAIPLLAPSWYLLGKRRKTVWIPIGMAGLLCLGYLSWMFFSWI